MGDQLVSTDNFDASKMALTGARKILADLNGSPAERLTAQLEAKGVVIPPHSTLKDLQNLLFQHESREQKTGGGNTAWTRYDKAWNDLCRLWSKAKAAGLRTEEQRPVPKSPPEVTRADAEAMEQIYRELSFELGEYENTTPAERRLQKIEAEQQRLSHAQFYLLKKLNEVIDHINNPRPTNVLHGGPYLAASNGAD